jgi:hypothetical protein
MAIRKASRIARKQKQELIRIQTEEGKRTIQLKKV